MSEEDSRKRSRFEDGSSPPGDEPDAKKPLDPKERARQIAARFSSMLPKDDAPPGSGGSAPTGGSLVKKVYIPVKENPDVNFIGLLIGPGGQTHRDMQQQSGAKVSSICKHIMCKHTVITYIKIDHDSRKRII